MYFQTIFCNILSTIDTESFTSAMSKLAIWVLLPSLIFKFTLISQKVFEVQELVFWILGTDYFPMEKFRLRIIYSVKMLILDMLRNSQEEDDDDDSLNATVSTDAEDDGLITWEVEENPPKEEETLNGGGVRRSYRRRAVVQRLGVV